MSLLGIRSVLVYVSILSVPDVNWALSWSLRRSWDTLQAAPPAAGADLATLDGLRILGMICFIIEHVCWLNTLSYIVNPRRVEQVSGSSTVFSLV